MVFAMSKQNVNASKPAIFRSYESTRNSTPDCTIWEALYATMAHPDLFKSIDIGEHPIRHSFVGGELGGSNPIAHVLAEAKDMYPNRHVSCILSIGSGHAHTIRIPDPSIRQRLLRSKAVMPMRDLTIDSEREAEAMAARFQNTAGVYYRFNVDQGLQELNIGDWERLKEVLVHTQVYIGKAETNRGMDQVAQAIKDRKTAISVDYIG